MLYRGNPRRFDTSMFDMPNKPYAKGHDPEALVDALISGEQTAFDAIPRTGLMKLASPRASYYADPTTVVRLLPPMPADDSRQTAAELTETFLAVKAADVPFASYGPPTGSDPMLVYGADHKGPPLGPLQFRYSPAHVGPYVSQFLQVRVPFGKNGATLDQRLPIRTGLYGTTVATRDQILLGNVPVIQTLGPWCYMHNGRALASYVHQDPPYLFGLYAALICDAIATRSTLFTPLKNESGFVSYGGAVDLHCAIAEVVRHAMQAAWTAKFRIYRRRRPEELFADQGRLHPDFTLLSGPTVASANSCMPLLYAEGSPGHSDYPSGHAVIGGAVATLLKAWFKNEPWTAAPLHSRDGKTQEIYPNCPPLSVHGELDKLASNYGWGRNFAGIHFRSSCAGGMAMGESIAIEYLKRMLMESYEPLGHTSFTGFDGQLITI